MDKPKIRSSYVGQWLKSSIFNRKKLNTAENINTDKTYTNQSNTYNKHCNGIFPTYLNQTHWLTNHKNVQAHK